MTVIRYRIYAVDVNTGAEFSVGRPRVHMTLPGTAYGGTLSSDGSMAVLIVASGQTVRNAPLEVVMNWAETGGDHSQVAGFPNR